MLPEVTVLDTTPLHGDGIDRDKVPAMVQTLRAEDFVRTNSFTLTDTLGQRVPGVSTTDVQGSTFLQDLRYRGFAASPLQGTPQGLAVYQHGIRLNEAFGDTVNWDLIPEVAIDRADIWTNNPAFGLNALGGAVSIRMKNGFTWQGSEGEVQGGSYGRYGGSLQYGVQKNTLGFYLTADAVHDDGWRHHSAASLARVYADLGWKRDRLEFHLIGSGVSNRLGVGGPTPIEMVRQNEKSVYTWPQRTTNEMGLLALTGRYSLPDTWALQSNVYVRKFKQTHVDGNNGEFTQCSDSSADPTTLCLDDEEFIPPSDPPPASWKNQFIMDDPSGHPIPFTAEDVPYGTVDRTWTDTLTVGGSLQATNTLPLLGHNNYFVAGASIDHSTTTFHSNSHLGYISPNLFVGPNADVAGTGTVIHNIPDTTVDPQFSVLFGPVKLKAHNSYYGLYGADTFDITSRLSFTLGARLNIADIEMDDESGKNPALNGHHSFTRVNPQAGLTYKVLPSITSYIGYSEANRAPTPLELNCSGS
ncbi:MAG: TonB-dependent receptor [Deltaproteobacteria bacterium]|nr:TonB-dependent receptor [Deltaproteobacteria bacterium]